MNIQTFGEQLRAKLIAEKLVKREMESGDTFIGCTDEEIKQVMEEQNVSFLPEPYRDFLRVMGKYPGGLLFSGEGVTYGSLLDNKGQLNEVMDDNHFQFDRDDHFVFLGHYPAYYYFFFTKDRDQDPAIYAFLHSVGSTAAEIVEITPPTFTAFFNYMIERTKDRFKGNIR